MNNIHQYTDGIASNAVLLAGFTAFFSISPGPSVSPFLAGCYYVTSVLTLVSMIYIVVCSSILGALGPTYGINGREMDSMHKAVQLMKRERKWMMNVFMIGFVFFGLCELAAVWIECEYESVSAVCSLIILAGIAYIMHEVRRMKRDFKFDELHEDESVEAAAPGPAGCAPAGRRRSGGGRSATNANTAEATLVGAGEFLNQSEILGDLVDGGDPSEKPGGGRQVSLDPMSNTRR